MIPLIGAIGGALSLLNSVQQVTGSSGLGKAGDVLSSLEKALGGNSGEPSKAVAGSGQGAPALSQGTLATLIALQGQDGTKQKGGLFGRIDTNGDGKISKNEFGSTLDKVGVDAASTARMFGELDADSDGSISKLELAPGRRDHKSNEARRDGLSALLNSTDFTGASTKTANNADGSSTTTITYADGSSVSVTTPAASSGTGGKAGGTHEANLLDRLIRLQSQLGAQKSAGASTIA